jgi:hypothetical protein
VIPLNFATPEKNREKFFEISKLGAVNFFRNGEVKAEKNWLVIKT